MIKLTDLILEARNRPKAVIMAGGAGSGKSYLLNQLDLGGLIEFNPDKYVEDPDHPYYGKLGPASTQVNKDVNQAVEDKTSFVWDTTASGVQFNKTFDKLRQAGYDLYMVMVYTHPMISYISNFSRKRNIPAPAVFSTWRNVYQQIADYNKKLGGNMSIFINDRGGEYKEEVQAFDIAAKSGIQGIKDYLEKYNEKHGIGGSSFFKPVEMSQQEEEEFNRAASDVDWDKDNRSEDKAIKNAFLKAYQKNGVGPGDDKLRDAVKKYRDSKAKRDKDHGDVLENIAEMLFSPTFQELLEHSTPAEIDSAVQNFLA